MKLPVRICPDSGSYVTASHSACPSPCTAPPSTCPVAICGLTTRPMSFTDAYDTTCTCPVSGSTSTSHTWHAFGQDGPPTAFVMSTSMRAPGWRAASSKSPMPRSVPFTA